MIELLNLEIVMLHSYQNMAGLRLLFNYSMCSTVLWLILS